MGNDAGSARGAGAGGRGARRGVSWHYLCFKDQSQALVRAEDFAQREDVSGWYVGACKFPHQRFYEEPSPHKFRFDAMFVLLVGRRMNMVETKFIRNLKQVAKHKMNKSEKSTGIHKKSIRFIYSV